MEAIYGTIAIKDLFKTIQQNRIHLRPSGGLWSEPGRFGPNSGVV